MDQATGRPSEHSPKEIWIAGISSLSGGLTFAVQCLFKNFDSYDKCTDQDLFTCPSWSFTISKTIHFCSLFITNWLSWNHPHSNSSSIFVTKLRVTKSAAVVTLTLRGRYFSSDIWPQVIDSIMVQQQQVLPFLWHGLIRPTDLTSRQY